MALRRSAFGSIALILAWIGAGHAADPRINVTIDADRLPESYRTDNRLLITAREAHRAVTTLPGVVLIDVRTHEETMFNGVARPMHRHVPYVVADLDHSYDPSAGRYKLEPNPDFVKAVEMLLADMKLGHTATVMLYCSVGERSARAANLLIRSGFANVYSVADGFEGQPNGPAGPGWKGSGLPWTHRLAPSQVYKSPSF